MSFPKYPTYRNSGVEWIGEVPSDWRIEEVRRVARIVNGYPFDSARFSPDAGWPLVRIRDLGREETEARYAGEFVETAAITRDDVLIGMDGDFNVGRWLGNGRALLNQRMCCIRADDPWLTRFIEYVLPTPLRLLNEVTFSTTVKHLSSRDVERFRIAIPRSIAEVRSIVSFLDEETAKLDALVAEQQRLIALLREKRQALVAQSVLQGLDRRASLRPSGVEWLSDVPAHWPVVRIATLLREVAEAGSDELPILSVSIHDGVSDRELGEADLDRKVTRSDDRSTYKRVRPGDLVYNMMRAWQGAFGAVQTDGMVSPAYVVARPVWHVPAAYLEHVLRTPQAVTEMRGRSRGVTDFRLRLYWEEFKDMRVPVPPAGEIDAILGAVRGISAEVDALTTEAERAIGLLQERRAALIAAAVTGQIDVRAYRPTEEPVGA